MNFPILGTLQLGMEIITFFDFGRQIFLERKSYLTGGRAGPHFLHVYKSVSVCVCVSVCLCHRLLFKGRKSYMTLPPSPPYIFFFYIRSILKDRS